MKAFLTSRTLSYEKWGHQSNSFEFISYPQGIHRNRSQIRVNFEEMDYPLFSDMQNDDEFELEVILTRKPKVKTETKTFK